MNTGRFHRTMAQAFGPYTSPDLQPMPQPPSLAARVYRALASAAAAIVAVLLVVHLIAK